MTLRLLGRSSDQASAAQSAAIVVPKWRIGFLIMPTVISTLSSRFEVRLDMAPRRLLANHKSGRRERAFVRYFRRNQDLMCEGTINATKYHTQRLVVRARFKRQCLSVRFVSRVCGLAQGVVADDGRLCMDRDEALEGETSGLRPAKRGAIRHGRSRP